MIGYKFRSASSAEFIFDILINHRIYCADWTKLNDPLEGQFVTFAQKDARELFDQAVREIGYAKKKYRVCSLSETFDSHLLWAHYADGFNGVAIGIDLPESENIQKVEYRGVFAPVDLDLYVDPDQTARKILFSKYDAWNYEREIRILHDGTYFPLKGRIKSVIAGHRLGSALSDTIQAICEIQEIPFFRIGIGDEGLDADSVEPSQLLTNLKRKRKRRIKKQELLGGVI